MLALKAVKTEEKLTRCANEFEKLLRKLSDMEDDLK